MLVPTGMSGSTRPAATPGDVASSVQTLVQNLLNEQILTLEQIIQATYVTLVTKSLLPNEVKTKLYLTFVKVFDKEKIIPIIFKGFTNEGTNACFINAYLAFSFEFIRINAAFRNTWKEMVDKVIKSKQKGIHSLICHMYNSAYNRLDSTGIGTKGKRVVEAMISLDYSDSYGASQNDVLMFGNVLSDIFDMRLSSILWPYYNKDDKVPIRCFQFPQHNEIDDTEIILLMTGGTRYVTFGSFASFKQTQKVFEHALYVLRLIQFIEYKSGHYVFYRRLLGADEDEWLRFSDANVSYHENLDISNMKIVLSCYQIINNS